MLTPKRDDLVLFDADYKCHFCNCNLDASTTHELNSACVVRFVPPSLGGKRNRSNLVACCRLCSTIKRDLDVTKYSLASIRKWVNLRRRALRYGCCDAWADADVESAIVVQDTKRPFAPSGPEFVEHEQEVIEVETPEEKARMQAEAKRLAEKYGFGAPKASQGLAADTSPSLPTFEEQLKYLEESGKLAREASAKQDEEYRRINEERRKGNVDAKISGIKSKTIDDLIDESEASEA